MLTYNFSYPRQQGTSWAYHYPYGSGNTLVLNFSMPDSCYDDNDDSNIGDTGIDKDTGKDDGDKDKTDKEVGKDTDDKDKTDKDKTDKEVGKDDKDKTDKDKTDKEVGKDDKDQTGKDTDKDIGGTGDKAGNVLYAREITLDHTAVRNCGINANAYKKDIGHKAFNTSDILQALYPEMFDNPEIMKHIEEGAHSRYGAANFVFAFSSNLNYTWATSSNMWCYKCTAKPNHFACQDQSGDFKSFCDPAGYHGNQEYSRNFFTKVCPNLISESSSANIIKAKQLAPLIVVNSAGQMINKDGNNTQVYYSQLYPYLKDGRMKDCSGNTKCKELDAIFKTVAWDTDREIFLSTSGKGEKTSTYSYDFDDADIRTFIDGDLM